MALTNEQGGRQLGRFILYYALAFTESAICGYMWNAAMAGSGDFFAVKVRVACACVGGKEGTEAVLTGLWLLTKIVIIECLLTD